MISLFGKYITAKSDPVHVLRYHEDQETVYLYLDRISSSESPTEIIGIAFEYAWKTLASYDKKNDTLNVTEDMDLVFRKNQFSSLGFRCPKKDLDEYEALINEGNKWVKCCGNETAAIDFVRRIAWLKNPKLFDKCPSQLNSPMAIFLYPYIDHLETIEHLCSISKTEDVWDQIMFKKLKLKDGSKLKSRVGIPVDILEGLRKLNFDKYLSDIQTILSENKATAEEIRLSISFFLAIRKLGAKRKITINIPPDYEFDRMYENFLKTINLGVSASDILNNVARELIMFNCSDRWSFILPEAFRYSFDIAQMMRNSNRTPRLEQNIEKWHRIVARNMKIEQESRAEEYTSAAKRLNKRSMQIGDYLIKCPESETELVNIGLAYSNCLPIYRDKVIDENAMIYSVYRIGEEDKIPDVTFEVNSALDFLQIRTYFDENVEDTSMIKLLNEWKLKAKSIQIN